MTDYRFNERGGIVRVADCASIPADEGNADYRALIASGAEIAPFARWEDASAARAALITEVEAKAAALRFAVAGTSDGAKFAVYREKYAAATEALAGEAAALAALAPEAASVGKAPAELAAIIKAKGDAWRVAGFAIDAAASAHKVAIAALADVAAAAAYDTNAGWPA